MISLELIPRLKMESRELQILQAMASAEGYLLRQNLFDPTGDVGSLNVRLFNEQASISQP